MGKLASLFLGLLFLAPQRAGAAASISALAVPGTVAAGQDITVAFNTGAGCTYVGIALSPYPGFTCPNSNGYPYPWVLHDTVHYATGYDAAPDYRGLFGGGLNTGCSAQSLTFSVKIPPDAPSPVYVYVFAASTPMTIWGNNACSYDALLTSGAVAVTGTDTTLRANMMMQRTSGGEPSNVAQFAPSITNWGLWPLDASRFCARLWVNEPVSPAIVALSGSHYIMALNTGVNWGPAVATPFTSTVTYLGSSTACDATHQASHRLQVCYSVAARYIPGNGGSLKPGNDGDTAGQWWNGGSSFTRTDDYSQNSVAGTGFANRVNDIHFALYDAGSLVCERISWSTADPLSGQEPCGISPCTPPTPTFTATPTASPTRTRTPTPSITPTPRMALTKTVDRSTATIGDTLTYCLYWSNDSGTPQHMVLYDQLVPILSFVGGTPAPSQAGQLLTWDLGMVPAGSSGQVCFGARVDGYP
jgi:uncharacterized repeat protein (TIGR01451 family)